MKLNQLALATVLLTSAITAHAELTVSSMVGHHQFDNDTQVKTGDVSASVAVGYRTNENVGLEVRFAQSEPDFNDGDEARIQSTTLDSYYRFNTEGKLQPYGLIGGGIVRSKGQDITLDTTVANFAVGAFYQLTDTLALRAELRGVQYLEDSQSNNVDGIASVGVAFGFGGKKDAPVVAPAAVPEPVAPPVPADDDNDGVNNDLDKCPGTPVTVVVDENGCPKMLTETVAKEIRVLFDTNKSVVKPAFNAEIEAVAKLMKEYPTSKVEIQGHTDSRGSAELNEKLSQDRADAVAAVLTGNYGIEADRVSAKGYAASQPVADNTTVEGQTANRRVVAVAQGEVKVIIKK